MIDIDSLANELFEAMGQRIAVDPLTERLPEITVGQAYQVQLALVKKLQAAGRRVVGKKIGLTAKAIQQQFGVSEPDYGHLFDHMVVLNGQPVAFESLGQPRIEGEIGFLLGKDLTGPGVSVTEVLAATEAVMPAIEIIDSRIRDWKIKIQDTIADNGSAAGVVFGDRLTSARDLDLRLLGMVLLKNGQVIATGAGAAALGHPAAAVAWLANKLVEFDVSLKAGEVIISGSLGPAATVAKGDHIRVDFDRLGSAAVTFV